MKGNLILLLTLLFVETAHPDEKAVNEGRIAAQLSHEWLQRSNHPQKEFFLKELARDPIQNTKSENLVNFGVWEYNSRVQSIQTLWNARMLIVLQMAMDEDPPELIKVSLIKY